MDQQDKKIMKRLTFLSNPSEKKKPLYGSTDISQKKITSLISNLTHMSFTLIPNKKAFPSLLDIVPKYRHVIALRDSDLKPSKQNIL